MAQKIGGKRGRPAKTPKKGPWRPTPPDGKSLKDVAGAVDEEVDQGLSQTRAASRRQAAVAQEEGLAVAAPREVGAALAHRALLRRDHLCRTSRCSPDSSGPGRASTSPFSRPRTPRAGGAQVALTGST